jgi:hypothetical protein
MATTIDFPATPAIGDTYVYGTTTYIWGGERWYPAYIKGLQVSVITTSTAAIKNYLYVFTANLTLTLPASPTIGDRVGIANRSDVLTCVIARNGSNIAGLAEDMTVDVLNIGFELVYTDATQGWVLQ